MSDDKSRARAAYIDARAEATLKQRCPDVVICGGCGKEIDPDTCGCGESHMGSYGDGGHPHIPMGCDCYRSRS